jgi:phytoene desaturase
MQHIRARDAVVIIGAGVAGLTAGAYLARHGFHVRVLEASSKVGGCCGTTSINGYTFTDGAQYLIYSKMLDLVFSQLGFHRSDVLPLRRVTTPQTTHLPNGMAVTIGDDFCVTVDGGKFDIARAQDELRGMVKKWEPVGSILEAEDILLNPFSAWRLLSRAWRQIAKFGRSLEGEFRALFSEPYFRSALAAQVLYAGVPLHQLPSFTIVALVSALKEGMALPVGGMGKLPEALAHALRAHGGEVLLNERVEDIRVQNGHVIGVETKQHDFIACERVISTASAMTTYGTFLDPTVQPRSMMRKLQRTRLSPSAFCVQLGVSGKLPVESHLNYFVPMMEDLSHYFAPVRDLEGWGYYSVPTIAAPELAPTSGNVIEYFPVIRQDVSMSVWSDDRASQLGDESIHWLQSQLDITIAAKRVRSPRDFRDQLNLYNGAVYGVSAAQGVTGLFSHQSLIEGLYLAGQTTYPGLGVPTAALSGIQAANLVLKTRNSQP